MTSRESRLNLCVKVTCVICSDFLKTGEVRGYTIMSVQTTFLSHLSLLPFYMERSQIESCSNRVHLFSQPLHPALFSISASISRQIATTQTFNSIPVQLHVSPILPVIGWALPRYPRPSPQQLYKDPPAPRPKREPLHQSQYIRSRSPVPQRNTTFGGKREECELSLLLLSFIIIIGRSEG
jgi:hypothetical protein